MSKKRGMGKFIAGAAVGAGLGILFAPKKGSETRRELKEKMDELLEQVKDIDTDKLKKDFEKKIAEIRDDLTDLDKEKALKIAKKRAAEIKKKSEELVHLAKVKGTPILKDAAEEMRLKTIEVTKQVLEKLEKTEIK